MDKRRSLVLQIKEIEGMFLLKNRIPIPALKHVNTYIYTDGEDCSAIIDPGLGRHSAKQVIESIKLLGLRESSIEKLVATHFHVDHTTASSFLAEGAMLLIGEEDRRIIEEMANDEGMVNRVAHLYYSHGMPREEAFRISKEHPAFSRIDLYRAFLERHKLLGLREKDVLKLCRTLELQVIEVPGHTPGHIAFKVETDNLVVLIVGDHVLSDITPNIPLLFWEIDLLAKYLCSLKRLIREKPSILLPGHRASIYRPLARINDLLTHHYNRLLEIINILQKEGSVTAYRIATQMTWNVPFNSWADFPLPQKYFALAEALSHLRYLYSIGLVDIAERGNTFLFKYSGHTNPEKELRRKVFEYSC